MRTRNRIRTCTARALNAVPPASWATRAWGGRATDLRASGRARTGYLRCTRAAHPRSCCAGVAARRPGRASSAYVSSAGFEPAPSAPSTPCLYRLGHEDRSCWKPRNWWTRAATGSRTPVSAMARWRTDRCATATDPRSPLEARQSLRRGSNPRYPPYRDRARPVGRRHGIPRAGRAAPVVARPGCLERPAGIEPASSVWKTDVSAGFTTTACRCCRIA
jgi:hypothetical protein